ncbi:unnamed protein product [Rotaria socialis]|uniref:Methyltransferase domain-containing protein n=1 Tax=Rotaria socialis TaxID=392032 RepID=A0A819XZZ3_9BILA|nr:unnamed protein product [Rotaria socialis]CAF4425361.1 unnamed protein product [Rotaria socialis]
MSNDQDENAPNISEHFSNIASDYHAATLFHSSSSSHEQWLKKLVFDALDLKRDHILADVGCGSGDDCLWLLNKMNNDIKTIGCDPSLGMIEIFNNQIRKQNLTSIVQALCMDAVTFSQQKQWSAYNRLLMKQCVHLMSPNERLLAFRGFHEQFNCNDNKLVIVTRPGKDIFPFDKQLELCGFTNIQCDTYEYTFDDSVTLDDWINFIQKRLWSIFSPEKINEEQMIDLISYLKETYKHEKFKLKDKILVLHCTTKNH